MKRKRGAQDIMGEMDIQEAGHGDRDSDLVARNSTAVHLPVPENVPVPRKEGHFVPLKTTLETRAVEKIGKVYVTGVPAKLASTVLNLVRKLLPDDGGIDFQHLRRFAKLKDLNAHLSILLSSSSTTAELFLIAGPVSAIPFTDLNLALSSILGADVSMVEVDVPILAPTSQDQATAWTKKYWPTVYKKSNPFGPHPSIVERAEEEMRGEVGGWMELAERVAEEAEEGGRGERVGVVVVERRGGRGRVVAVAGDGRWRGWKKEGGGGGNVVAHAVMRAVGMVAGGLKDREEIGSEVSIEKGTDSESTTNGSGIKETPSRISPVECETVHEHINTNTTEAENKGPHSSESSTPSAPLPDHPISPFPTKPSTNTSTTILPSLFTDAPSSLLEHQHFDPSGNANGYLCHDLEIYCTHEPCVMCSMAIVHARFGRVVFKRRMPETGGMCADGGLGHGLWWRKELNWTMLGWSWVCEGEGEDGEEGKEGRWDLHA